jgi:positive regulator of sigma E activity
MKTLEHPGIVKAVRGSNIEVELTSSGSDNNHKHTVVVNLSGRKLRPGDPVMIVIERSPEKLLFFTVVLPLIFIIIVYIIFKNGTNNEPLSAIMTVFSLCPFFSFIWILRDKILTSIKLSNRKF